MKIKHLSYSQVSTWLRCGRTYYLRYLEKVRLRRGVGVALPLGSAVHAAVEKNLTQKIESKVDLPEEEVGEAAIGDFMDRAERDEIDFDGKKPEDVATLAGELAEVHTRELAPRIQPLLVETELRADLLDRGWDLLAYIDLVDEERHIVDLKTAARAKAVGSLERDLQLSLYAAIWRKTTGKIEAGLRHDVLIKPTKTMGVRTQQIITSRTETQIGAALDIVGHVADGIEAEIFPANPGQACNICDYRGTEWCSLGGEK